MDKNKSSKNIYPAPPSIQKRRIMYATDNLAENQRVIISPELILELWPDFVNDFYRDKAEKEMKNKKSKE